MAHWISAGEHKIDLDQLESPDDSKEKTVFLSQIKSETGCFDEDWKSDEKAANNYELYKAFDPYPDIDPALLNSADIVRYVAKTGMICPFNPEKLSGATYEVAIMGKVVYWNDEGEKKVAYLKSSSDSFELGKNSIAFVTLEPYFRIPDYLALRFNLKIAHVYKGLLLGTGPIVDPGFQGYLSIPLHNLTGNTYRFYAGEGIIKMEFTKLSPHRQWRESTTDIGEAPPIDLVYRRNFIRPGRSVDEYIAKALRGNTSSSVVRSSIPDEIAKVVRKSDEIQVLFESFRTETRKDNTSFREDIEGRLRNVQIVNVATILAIAAMVVSVLTFTWNAVSGQINSASARNSDTFEQIEDKYNSLSDKYDQLQNKYEELIEKVNGGK